MTGPAHSDNAVSGLLKAVVCTSSLDPGVDYLRVERLLRIGSPECIARLMQHAGRSRDRVDACARIDRSSDRV